MVERSHGKPRSTNGSDRGRVQNPGRKLDKSGLCCDELDDITDTEALLIYITISIFIFATSENFTKYLHQVIFGHQMRTSNQ